MTKANLIAIAAILNILNLEDMAAAILDISEGATTLIHGVWVTHRVEHVTNLGPGHGYDRSWYGSGGEEFEQAESAAWWVTQLIIAKETAI